MDGGRPSAISRRSEFFSIAAVQSGPFSIAAIQSDSRCGQVRKQDDPLQKLVELFEGSKLGKKSGQGFYTWVGGKAQKVGAGGTADPALAQRMLKPLLAATQRMVREGIVADAGVIFGTGFAPYTGGPMNYMSRQVT
jgi:hypothetical protein